MKKLIALFFVCLGLNLSAYARSSADNEVALQVGQDAAVQDAKQAVDKTNTTTESDPSKDKDPEAAEGVQSR